MSTNGQTQLDMAQQRAEDGDADAEPRREHYINKLTNSELDAGTVKMLSNMMSKDFVLGNYSDAESNEHRWLTRIIKLQVEAQHPHDDSMWQGRFRQVASGRGDQHLSSLSDRELTIIRQFIRGVLSRSSRSRDGWQQDKMNESIAVQERRDVDEDDGGFLGR